ncbi:MAG: pyridoxamine 5'-phosphate oxidase family protein [Ferruginibacter sp.]
MAYKNLANQEGIDKIKELVTSADICMFASHYTNESLSARPMGTQEVDEEGAIWFFSKSSSNLNTEIEADNRVQLFYANKAKSEYLSISGTATVIKDEEKAKELWTRWVKTWFTEGPEDPELTIIKVEPQDAYYWDTVHNKMVNMVKMMAGAIVGKTMYDGVEGHIEI